MPEFTCTVCDTRFEVAQKSLDKFPGWTPKYCRQHSPKKKGRTGGAGGSGGRRMQEENLTLDQVLEKYEGGPQTGVFTDGSCIPNPGPGGWGVVWVQDGEIVAQRHGQVSDTTNNRMELTALIEAFKLLEPGATIEVFTDSELCVNTITKWAASWEKNGWRRKGGPIKNLELVQELWALAQSHPNVSLKWIRSHSGELWNEYADSLATAWARKTL